MRVIGIVSLFQLFILKVEREQTAIQFGGARQWDYCVIATSWHFWSIGSYLQNLYDRNTVFKKAVSMVSWFEN